MSDTATVTRVFPGPGTIATAGTAYATAQGAFLGYFGDTIFDAAERAAFRLASVYPVGDRAVEVVISPDAIAYAVSEHGTLLTADSIADRVATQILDMAAERAGLPFDSDALITTVSPGVLRLTW